MSVNIKFKPDDSAIRSTISRMQRDLSKLGVSSSKVGTNLASISSRKLGGASRGVDQITRSVDRLDGRVARATSSFKRLATGIAAATAVAFGSKGFVAAGDAVIDFDNKVRLLTGPGAGLTSMKKRLKEISIETSVSLDQTAANFNKLGLALEANYDTGKIATFVGTLQKAAKIGGSSAETINASLTQLSQGLGAGELRGAELMSVLEGTPVIARAIAKGMGVAYGDLKGMAEDGLITTTAVVEAILGQQESINKRFSTLTKGAGASLSTMTGMLKIFFGEINAYFGISEGLSRLFLSLASFFSEASGPFIEDMEKILKFGRGIGTELGRIARGIWSKVGSQVSVMFNSVASAIASSASGLWSRISAPFREVVDNLMTMFWDFYIWLVGNSVWPDTWDLFVEQVSGLWSRIKGSFDEVLNNLKDFGEDVLLALGLSMERGLGRSLARVFTAVTLMSIRKGHTMVGTIRNMILAMLVTTGVSIFTTMRSEMFKTFNSAEVLSSPINGMIRKASLQVEQEIDNGSITGPFHKMFRYIAASAKQLGFVLDDSMYMAVTKLKQYAKATNEYLTRNLNFSTIFSSIGATMRSAIEEVEDSFDLFTLEIEDFFGMRLSEAVAVGGILIGSLMSKTIRMGLFAGLRAGFMFIPLLFANNGLVFTLISEGISGMGRMIGQMIFDTVRLGLSSQEMSTLREELFILRPDEGERVIAKLIRSLTNIMTAVGLGLGSSLIPQMFPDDSQAELKARIKDWAGPLGLTMATGMLYKFFPSFRSGVQKLIKGLFGASSIEASVSQGVAKLMAGAGKSVDGAKSAGSAAMFTQQGKMLRSFAGVVAGWELGGLISKQLDIAEGTAQEAAIQLGASLGFTVMSQFVFGLLAASEGTFAKVILKGLTAATVGLALAPYVQDYLVDPLLESIGMAEISKDHPAIVGIGSMLATALSFSFGSSLLKGAWSRTLGDRVAGGVSTGLLNGANRGKFLRLAGMQAVGSSIGFAISSSIISNSKSALSDNQELGVYAAGQIAGSVAAHMAGPAAVGLVAAGMRSMMQRAGNRKLFNRRNAIGAGAAVAAVGGIVYALQDDTVLAPLANYLDTSFGPEVSDLIMSAMVVGAGSLAAGGITKLAAGIAGYFRLAFAGAIGLVKGGFLRLVGAGLTIAVSQVISESLTGDGIGENLAKSLMGDNAWSESIGKAIDAGLWGVVAYFAYGAGALLGGAIVAIPAAIAAAIVGGLLVFDIVSVAEMSAFVSKFMDGLKSHFEGAVSWSTEMWAAIMGLDAVDWFALGESIIDDMFEGLQTLGSKITDWWKSLFEFNWSIFAPDQATNDKTKALDSGTIGNGIISNPADYANRFKSKTGKANGGFISGAGTSTSDSIPARLSNGEYVIKASSVARYGKGFLDAVNTGQLSGFSSGGPTSRYNNAPKETGSSVINYFKDWLNGVEDSTKAVTSATDELKSAVKSAGSKSGKSGKSSAKRNTLGNLAKLGGVDIDALSALSNQELTKAETLIKSITSLEKQREALGLNDYKNRRRITDELTNQNEQLDELLEKNTSFSDEMSTSISRGISSALIGAESASEVILGLLDQVTGRIIDNFANGLTDYLFESFNLDSIFEQIDGFSLFGKKKGSTAKTGGAGGGLNLSGMMDGLLGTGGGGGLFSSLFGQSFGSFLGFAEGGHVRGPGTSTSDSIPAWLSNNEYVVNAKSTKQWRPFLDAINSGAKPQAFATGGSVGPVRAAAIQSSGAVSQQQTFEINIQGDVSRQTRKEIIRSLPEIAAGVNSVNRENGRR